MRRQSDCAYPPCDLTQVPIVFTDDEVDKAAPAPKLNAIERAMAEKAAKASSVPSYASVDTHYTITTSNTPSKLSSGSSGGTPLKEEGKTESRFKVTASVEVMRSRSFVI